MAPQFSVTDNLPPPIRGELAGFDRAIVEQPDRKDTTDDTVLVKATAARTWVSSPTRHAASYGGKP